MPVYKDTPQNRKLNRVGKPYGKDATKSEPKKPEPKKETSLGPVSQKLEEEIKKLESDVKKNTEIHNRLKRNLKAREDNPQPLSYLEPDLPTDEEYVEVKKLLDKINSDTEKIKKKTEQILIAKRDKKDIPKKEKVYYEKLILAIPDQTVVAKTLSTKVPKQEQNPQLNKALKRLEALRKKPKSIIISTLIKEQDFIIRKLREIARIANLRKKIK